MWNRFLFPHEGMAQKIALIREHLTCVVRNIHKMKMYETRRSQHGKRWNPSIRQRKCYDWNGWTMWNLRIANSNVRNQKKMKTFCQTLPIKSIPRTGNLKKKMSKIETKKCSTQFSHNNQTICSAQRSDLRKKNCPRNACNILQYTIKNPQCYANTAFRSASILCV